MQKHNDAMKTSGHRSFEKYTSHFIERVVSKRELETEQNCNILTPTLMAITAFLSRSPGLINRGLGGPASLGHGPHSSIFSPTATAQSGVWGPPLLGTGSLYHILSPTNLNFLSPGLYNNLTPTLLIASVTISHSIQPLDSKGYILIFLDRMYQLFTQVHFLFWQLGRVRGQYTTPIPETKVTNKRLSQIFVYTIFRHSQILIYCIIPSWWLFPPSHTYFYFLSIVNIVLFDVCSLFNLFVVQ